MKKIYLYTALFAVTLLAGITIFYACKKNDEFGNINESLPSKVYSPSLIQTFMTTPIAIDFLNEVDQIPINVVNGLLSFNSVDDYNTIYDLLITYSDLFDELVEEDSVNYSQYVSEETLDNIILYLFEYHIGITSLRSDIEEQILLLQQGGGIPENSDPDEHYIVSPFQRTLLSPYCEMIVADLICVSYDDFTVGIMNYDWATLSQLHQAQRTSNFDEIKANEFCSEKINAFILTESSTPSLNVDFTYVRDLKNSNMIQFVNHSYSEAYKEMIYHWNFGDGTTSNEKNPKHTFNFDNALANVTLNVSLGRFIINGSSSIIIPDNDIPLFTATPTNNGTGIVSFNCTYPNQANVAKYIWNFGDGNAPVTSFENTVSHIYILPGTYQVTLAVYNKDYSLFGTANKNVTVNSVKNCCKGNDRPNSKKIDYTHNGETRRIKLTLRVSNSWLIHRIVTKTKHMKKNAQGNWVLKNANEINTGFNGYIYKPSGGVHECGTETFFDMYKKENKNGKNRPQIVFDYNVGVNSPFTVDRECLNSQHIVITDNIIRYGANGLSVHQKPCN